MITEDEQREIVYLMDALSAFGSDLHALRNYVNGVRHARRRSKAYYRRVSDMLDVIQTECKSSFSSDSHFMISLKKLTLNHDPNQSPNELHDDDDQGVRLSPDISDLPRTAKKEPVDC